MGMTDKPVTAASSPDVASSIGFTCGLIAVLLMFLLPGNLLSLLGIGYDSPGSFPAFKIHPSTYLTAFGLMATLLAVLQRKPVAGLAEWRVPVIFILLTVACALCSFLSVGTAGASNYVDTFVAAGALAMILATGGPRQRRKLGYLILALVLASVVISFWESVADTPEAADVVVAFVRSKAELATVAVPAIAAARRDKLAWIAYPKAGKLGTDLNRDLLSAALAGEGVQPVRQIAIDEVWSGLKVVWRRSERRVEARAPGPGPRTTA